jgi:hypothetical protein
VRLIEAERGSDLLMIIQKPTTVAYYPISSERTA